MTGPVRVGVIGCGAIALRTHVPAFRSAGAVLTAFASRRVASAESAASESGSGVACADWAELLDRDDVDAVTICTPNALHAEQAVAAARAGKHVLVEKPFTTTVDAADSVIAAGRAAGVVVMTAHNMRFATPVVAAQQAVRRGALGTVQSVRAVFCHAGPGAWAPESRWFFDPRLAGGGALLDLGVHLVDTIRVILADEFATVCAVLAEPEQTIDKEAVMAFRTTLGVLGTLQAGWRSPTGPELVIDVVGSEGSLTVTPAAAVLTRAGLPPETLVLAGAADTPQAAFLRAVDVGAAQAPDATDGRAAVAVVEAGYRSAESGRSVDVAG